jgi:hypothetical protein
MTAPIVSAAARVSQSPDRPAAGGRGEFAAAVEQAGNARQVGVHREPGPAGLLVPAADQR